MIEWVNRRRMIAMSMGLQQMVQELSAKVPMVAPEQLKELLDHGTVGMVVDVREPDEFAGGHVPGAVNIPRGVLELKADPNAPMADEQLVGNQDEQIVVYCFRAPGFRSLSAADTLQRMGYRGAVAMAAGSNGWSEAGFPLEGQ
jgi:rhodanese-related sulfurtransferase